MRIIHTTNSLSRLGGGVAPVVWSIADGQQRAGHDVSLMALGDRYDAQDWPATRSAELRVRTFKRSAPGAAFWSLAMHRALQDSNSGGEVLHQHGLWSMWSHSVGCWQRQWKRPVLLAAHGGLSDATLNRNPWRKKLFELLCGNRRLRNATCLHALCEPEAAAIRRRGVRVPVIVVPNGVRSEDYRALPDSTELARCFPRSADRPIVLFLGRIHPLKGVSALLDAWKRLENRRRDGWLLVLAGPNDFGFEDKMKAKAEALSLDRDVLFTGPLYGRAKLEALAAASLFVLPSLSEGFPNSLLEAMACKLPLVQTHQCNFDEVAAAGAGWVGHPDADSLSEMLAEATSTSADELQAIGGRGYDLVRKKYTWDHVCRELESVYRWMLVGGAAPASLYAA
ncbi:MAG: glycosyltransferase [Candidatus Nealsonbacteria bacterium]|nr:glycosyltransferase [Candidatus Nealsonbacteria bacterium]